MNPHGIVVNENTNGIVTVNGHSYEGEEMQTENTNFALLVAKHFSEPFKDSNGYGESIARLSNICQSEFNRTMNLFLKNFFAVLFKNCFSFAMAIV